MVPQLTSNRFLLIISTWLITWITNSAYWFIASIGKGGGGRIVERSASWLQQPIHLHARNLFPWVLRTFSLRIYPGNTRDRACEWLRFPDRLEHAQTARAITKKRRLKRSELRKPRYLRNVNTRRNGTCKEDNIVYIYIYIYPLDFTPSSDRFTEHLRDLLLLLLSTIILTFICASHRSGTVPHKIPIIFSVGFNIKSFVITEIIATPATAER